jgi:hypothetical protein
MQPWFALGIALATEAVFQAEEITRVEEGAAAI